MLEVFIMNSNKFLFDDGSGLTHILDSHETIYDVATKYNITLNELMAYNNIGPYTQIEAGMVIKIPDTRTNIHTVQDGETLPFIAQLYGLSVDSLMRENRLTSPMIYPGMMLNIIPTNNLYTVRNGDTLSQIASYYGMSIDYLMGINRLNSMLIYPGQQLIVS
jgi:LysM repeat protein